MKKTLLLAVLFLCTLAGLSAQSKKFSKKMSIALGIHDTASTVGSELMALKAFQELVQKYPEEWLPAYWAAYLCTQIARLDGRSDQFPENLNGRQLLLDSKSYYDQAFKIKANKTDQEHSDFLMLEGFIYGFYINMVAKTDEERATYQKIKQDRYKQAILLNPRNPLMYVMQGISLSQRDEYQSVLAGIGLLDYAESIFNKTSNRALSTHWNKDFIKFWRARGENKLKGLLENAEEKG